MPAILTEDLAWEWLFGNLNEERISEIAGYQFPAEQMEACTISKDLKVRWNLLRRLFIRIWRIWNWYDGNRRNFFKKFATEERKTNCSNPYL